MRRQLLLNYLYICALSVLSQSPSCQTQTANLIASSSDSPANSNEEHTFELKGNDARTSDGTSQRIQPRQIIDQHIRDTVRSVRRKRELRDEANSVRYQISSNPSERAELTSGEQRSKKSNHQMERMSRKLESKTNDARLNAVGVISVQEDQADQEKRDLHKQQGVASRVFLSTGEGEGKSEQREAKRSSHSGEAVKVAKPKSREIKESVLARQSHAVKEKLKDHDNVKYAALRDDNKSQKPVSENEDLEDEADLEDKSSEYDETGDDDDMEAPSGDTGYKENNLDVSESADDESEKLDLAQSTADDDNFEGQDAVKREADTSEEDYEDVEGQDDTCEKVRLVDEANYRQSKIQSEPGLLEKHDSRVKRYDAKAGEDEATNLKEDARQQLEGGQHVENFRDDSKREMTQTAIASLKSGRITRGENSKRQVASENLAQSEPDDEVEAKIKSVNEEPNEISNQEFQNDNPDKTDVGEKSDNGLDQEPQGSEDVKKEQIMANIDEDGRSSKQASSPDETGKYEKSYSDYEKKVEQQIQQKIDSIKEEIKRDVEEKQRVREIEINNAKYDEMQNEIEEDEDENNQSLDIPSERKSVSKRSIIGGIGRQDTRAKRHILRRVRRSDTTDARQLQTIEGVVNLDPDVLLKARLRHESIRKRSAPIYGAADEEIPDTAKPLIKRSTNPRRVYLVSNEQKTSPSSVRQEVRNTIPIGTPLDPTLHEDSSSPAKNRAKRNPERFSRRRRASAVIPEGRVAFLGYRPQDDDENDEGSEFDDDGFEDRTSNLQQDKSYAVPQRSMAEDENTANFLFASINRDRNDFLVRHKRAGIHNDEIARLHGGGALTRRQTRARAKQMQTAKMTSRKNIMNRDRRQSGNVFQGAKSDSVSSLVGSSQELTPRLATEYREAFGGLQSDPGGALARFKRVKRGVNRGSLD